MIFSINQSYAKIKYEGNQRGELELKGMSLLSSSYIEDLKIDLDCHQVSYYQLILDETDNLYYLRYRNKSTKNLRKVTKQWADNHRSRHMRDCFGQRYRLDFHRIMLWLPFTGLAASGHEKGQLIDGQKVGIWSIYDEDNNDHETPVRRIDYGNNSKFMLSKEEQIQSLEEELEAQRKEQERLAQIEQEKLEAERKEQERLAQIEQEKLEAERKEQERLAQIERERLAQIEQAKREAAIKEKNRQERYSNLKDNISEIINLDREYQ